MLLGIFQLNAQGPEFDQLKSDILSASTEERKIEGLINLGINYGRFNNDSLRFYADSLSSTDFNSPELVDAGQAFLKAVEVYGNNDLEGSIPLFQESLELLETLDVPNLYFRCRNFLGIAYTRLREFDSALDVLEGTLEIAEEENADISHKRAAHANLINVFRRVQDFASAIYHTEMLISYSAEGSMNRSLAFSYMNMGQMLLELHYYQRGLDALNLIDYDFLTGSMPLAVDKNKARAHQALEQYDSAIYFFEKSLEYEGTNFNPDLKMSSKISLIELYTQQKEFNKIPEMISSAEGQINARMPYPAHTDLAQAMMAYYLEMEDLTSAIETGQSLEGFLKEKNALAMSQDVFLTMSAIYEDLGETALALKYNKLFTDLEISRIDATRKASIQQARAKLAELEATRKVSEAEENKVFYQQLSAQQWGLLLIMLILCVVIFRFYRKEKTEKIQKEDQLGDLKKEVEVLSKKEKKEVTLLKLKSHAILQLEKICYIQSDGPYVEIFQVDKDRPEIDRNTLKHLLAELPDNFVQVHRSYIVNVQFIQSLYSNKLELKNGKEISVSRSFKPNVEAILKASA